MANITNARQLGAVVRAARKKRGLSQESLAAQAGVSRAWLARFETGHAASSIAPIFRILRTLELGLTVGERTITEAESVVLAALADRNQR
jgi:HTH-type transcriptional regulator/antitoxin HipB